LGRISIDDLYTLPLVEFLEVVKVAKKGGLITPRVSRAIIEFIVMNEEEMDATNFDFLARTALKVSNSSDTFCLFLKSLSFEAEG
jgi:hypothetical protein